RERPAGDRKGVRRGSAGGGDGDRAIRNGARAVGQAGGQDCELWTHPHGVIAGAGAAVGVRGGDGGRKSSPWVWRTCDAAGGGERHSRRQGAGGDGECIRRCAAGGRDRLVVIDIHDGVGKHGGIHGEVLADDDGVTAITRALIRIRGGSRKGEAAR